MVALLAVEDAVELDVLTLLLVELEVTVCVDRLLFVPLVAEVRLVVEAEDVEDELQLAAAVLLLDVLDDEYSSALTCQHKIPLAGIGCGRTGPIAVAGPCQRLHGDARAAEWSRSSRWTTSPSSIDESASRFVAAVRVPTESGSHDGEASRLDCLHQRYSRLVQSVVSLTDSRKTIVTVFSTLIAAVPFR